MLQAPNLQEIRERPVPEFGPTDVLIRSGYAAICHTDFVFNVGDLERLPGSDATPLTLKSAGLIGSRNRPVKILGKGELSRTLSVAAHAFSRTAREKIEKAGGEAEEIG